jgi:carbamoyl-phosphate synthase large subunit
MINCNPETVSTDYDTSDRLYFEPLTAEDVLEILRVEQSKGELVGVIVQFGGQTPLKLADTLQSAGIPILGTSPDAIDLAETASGSPSWSTSSASGSRRTASPAAATRPWRSRTASATRCCCGRATCSAAGDGDRRFRRPARSLHHHRGAGLGDSPVLIDQYLRDAIECDVDALCDGDRSVVAAVMQHIEEAGVHSGDSACSLPPYSLPTRSSPRWSARPKCWRWRSGGRADERPVRGQGRPRST